MTGFTEDDRPSAVATYGLTKRHRGTAVLDRLELRVPHEAVYVLVGANGAGKSTPLKMLLDLERADAGKAEVLGLDTARRGAEVRAQVGYLPERHDHGYGWMTCRQLLRHASAYYTAWDHPYADHLCRTLEVQLERKVGTLSKGESRRLQFVLALAHRPLLLLLDEPTDGLDPVVRSATLTLLAEHLADSPATVIIATHHIGEVETLTDHVGVLRGGRLALQLPRDDFHRTVQRYRMEVPERWDVPAGIRCANLRRSSAGRDVQCVLVGEERAVRDRLASTGARVHDVTPLSLTDATTALLRSEEAA